MHWATPLAHTPWAVGCQLPSGDSLLAFAVAASVSHLNRRLLGRARASCVMVPRHRHPRSYRDERGRWYVPQSMRCMRCQAAGQRQRTCRAGSGPGARGHVPCPRLSSRMHSRVVLFSRGHGAVSTWTVRSEHHRQWAAWDDVGVGAAQQRRRAAGSCKRQRGARAMFRQAASHVGHVELESCPAATCVLREAGLRTTCPAV